MKAYTVINATTPRGLIAKVNEAIQKGWEPIGGMTNDGGTTVNPTFYQSMVLPS